MREFIAGALIFGLIGLLLGSVIADYSQMNKVHDAWSEVIVVDNGTLVANPSYYAYHPEELEGVRVISKSNAAIREAN